MVDGEGGCTVATKVSHSSAVPSHTEQTAHTRSHTPLGATASNASGLRPARRPPRPIR